MDMILAASALTNYRPILIAAFVGLLLLGNKDKVLPVLGWIKDKVKSLLSKPSSPGPLVVEVLETDDDRLEIFRLLLQAEEVCRACDVPQSAIEQVFAALSPYCSHPKCPPQVNSPVEPAAPKV